MSPEPLPRLVSFVRWASYAFSRVVWRVEFTGLENIPASDEDGLLIVSNHQTYFDPFWIALQIKRKTNYLAWDKAFEWPLIGTFIKSLGALPVSLDEGGTLGTLKLSLSILRKNGCLLVFPEGSRCFSDGQLLDFQTGAARLAIKSGATILPVTVIGGNNSWPQDYRLPRPAKVRVIYHKPIETTAIDGGLDPKELTKQLKTIITSAV